MNAPAEPAVASSSRVMLSDAVGGAAGSVHHPAQPPFKLSRASKDVAFGSLAGMVSKVFEHPFDLVKVRLQTQPAHRDPPMYRGALDCFRQTYRKEGVRGLYRGLSMPVFGATLENACLFFTYNFVQGQLRKIAGIQGTASSSSLAEDAERPLPMTYLGVAAACAGISASLVLTPVELIKCKMQVQMVAREVEVLAAAAAAAANPPAGQVAGSGTSGSAASIASRASGLGQRGVSTVAATSASAAATREQLNKALASLDGPLTILSKVVREEGIRGMWLGQTGTMLRETGGGVAWFLAFEQATRAMIRTKQASVQDGSVLTKKDLSSVQLVAAGALAGISYNVVLFPADSVKSTMQTEREWAAASSRSAGGAGAAFKSRGFIATFLHLYRTRGLRGLYAGCGVTCMRSAPSSAIIFLMYNRLEGLADDLGM